MKILVLNCGSSSIKYKLFDMTTKEVIAQGGIEKIGLKGSFLKLTLPNGEKKVLEKDIPEHTIGVEFILNTLISPEYGAIKSLDEINAVGHRMVHGGERFSESVLLNKEVLEAFAACNDLAPLHNPANLKGVNAVSAILPNIPQVGVFFGFPKDMFREACLRLEPTFFRFMKERPCYVLPDKDTGAINGLIQATTAIYNDRENRFRNQIAKNHLQSFMLDIYDKCYRYFDKQEIEGGSRQDEIFKKFVALVHENCISQREVNFYANELCISTKYLTGICRSVTGDSAKKIIDDFAILEIKVLLQSTELTMQDIADRLGFPDQSYLGRYFKRHEGMSPREYQNRYVI